MDGLYINEIPFVQLISLCIEHLYTPQLPQEEKGNIMKSFVRIDGLQTKIWTLNLHNAKQGICWSASLFEENWGKPYKTSVMVDGLQTRIWNKILQNIKTAYTEILR